jgi:hypothetical protein
MGYRRKEIYNSMTRGCVSNLSSKVNDLCSYFETRDSGWNIDGPLRTIAMIKGMRIRARKINAFFLIFSFIIPWMRKRSKRRMLIGTMAAFSFEANARIAVTKQNK